MKNNNEIIKQRDLKNKDLKKLTLTIPSGELANFFMASIEAVATRSSLHIIENVFEIRQS